VIVWEPGASTAPNCLDWEIVRGSRHRPATAVELARRCRSHHLVLDPLLDRHHDAVVVLGPSTGKERREYVSTVREFFRGIALAFGLQVMDLDQEQVCKALDIPEKNIVSQIRKATGDVICRDRRIVLAAGAAMAGVVLVTRGGEA